MAEGAGLDERDVLIIWQKMVVAGFHAKCSVHAHS